MNEAHLHLIVNHLPIVGFLFSVLLLFVALWVKAQQVRQSALAALAVAALSAIPAYLTGEGAEEVVEHLPGIQESLIEEHEELAETAFVLTQITGALALAGFALGMRKGQYQPITTLPALLAGIVTFGALAVAGNSGGKIRHPEILDQAGAGGLNVGAAEGLEYEDDD